MWATLSRLGSRKRGRLAAQSQRRRGVWRQPWVELRRSRVVEAIQSASIVKVSIELRYRELLAAVIVLTVVGPLWPFFVWFRPITIGLVATLAFAMIWLIAVLTLAARYGRRYLWFSRLRRSCYTRQSTMHSWLAASLPIPALDRTWPVGALTLLRPRHRRDVVHSQIVPHAPALSDWVEHHAARAQPAQPGIPRVALQLGRRHEAPPLVGAARQQA